MKVIRDKSRVDALVKREKIEEYFDTRNLAFELHQYEKGEILASPDRPMKNIIFLVEGKVQIYGILNDGGKLAVRIMEKPALLGDVEFCRSFESPLFTEAMTEVTCLELPLDRYKNVLDKDVKFLHLVLQSLVEKMVSNSKNDVETPTLEERVLFYMEHVFENHQFSGVEAATIRLRCSRRQLQRVLKKLCAEKRVIRTGKGSYKLNIS